jgi:cell division control protein 6
LHEFNSDKESPIIKPAAITFLAAKISTLSGDVRKALGVCRRAIELAELEARKQTLLKPLSNTASPNIGRANLSIKPIDVPQILKIVNEVYCSSVTSSMGQNNSDLPLHQKLIIASLLLMTNHGKKSKEVTMGKLHETYTKVCKKRGMTSASLSEAVSMAQSLESRGFLSLRSAKESKDGKLSLRIDDDEIEAAMQDKTLLSGILHDIDCISK